MKRKDWSYMNDITKSYLLFGFYGLGVYYIFGIELLELKGFDWTCALGIFMQLFGLYCIYLIWETNILSRYYRIQRFVYSMEPTPFAWCWFFGWTYYQTEVLDFCRTTWY